MLKPTLPIQLVDASVLIAAFTNDDTDDRASRAHQLLADHGRTCTLAVPALAYLELCAAGAGAWVEELGLIIAELDALTAAQAAEIGSSLPLHDATLPATALIHGIDRLYTFEPALLALDIEGVDVVEPTAAQGMLF
ncbi:type II toxin-antitoxin system VapC family toxin [Corynebacterium renale]|uniref:PIN domain-containing protein n=1 Tax=Corynebacterium renale TaxID=1724 RepID=A0A2A9DPR1_9CORY|nr:type II toxin-antitoxin system VapC family toxin [Corynebacterium renale]PFG27910.1 hypothetical protein ATK06_0992 [Corynebacterium renale]SQI21892.1 Uncharacterised protein [Corynebacterium renale]